MVTPLNPGVYKVTVTARGFQTTVVNSVEVQIGQSARVNVELSLGTVTENTVVTSDTPLLDTESGTLGHVVTNAQIVNLPLNGRSFYELARLTPGAALLPGRRKPAAHSRELHFRHRDQRRARQPDDLPAGRRRRHGSSPGRIAHSDLVDALQEFKVQQSAYSAEFSQAGGMLNATTKAGSNQFHGAAFEFLRDDAFDARNFFARETEKLKRHQFGGTLGGPIFRGRTFFFASYEGMREQQGLVFNSIVPTAAMKAGDFRAIANRIYDPSTRQPFADNTIPTGRLSPQALYFARFIPDPNTASGTFAWAPVRRLDMDQLTARVDQTFRDRHRLFAR